MNTNLRIRKSALAMSFVVAGSAFAIPTTTFAASCYTAWSAATVYSGTNNLASVNGRNYQAKWWTQGNDPQLSGQWDVWADLGACTAAGVSPSPTVAPTVTPVVTPTATPTATPTLNPTSTPSVTPTAVPTATPTPTATAKPTVTAVPTATTLPTATTQPGGLYPSLNEALATEQRLTDTQLMRDAKASIRTASNTVVDAVSPGNPNNPSNVKRVEGILSAAKWDYLFAKREASYTYTRMLQAIAKFPAICGDYTDGRDADQICRRSLATMFAHFGQETGGHDVNDPVPAYRQGLVHLREMGCNETGPGCGYNTECAPGLWQSAIWQCGTNADGSFKKYFGRGAKQLSYNFNYGPFSDAMFGTVRTLLDQPDLVASTWLNLASATFFFSYPQAPKPSMLQVIDGTWKPSAEDLANNIVPGFGVTTNIINGGVECGGGSEIQQSLNRIEYFKKMAMELGVQVPANEVLGCANMKQFGTSANSLKTYWDQNWGWNPSYADGKSYACQLVGYQTPYSALKAGDYVKCVEKNFNVILK